MGERPAKHGSLGEKIVRFNTLPKPHGTGLIVDEDRHARRLKAEVSDDGEVDDDDVAVTARATRRWERFRQSKCPSKVIRPKTRYVGRFLTWEKDQPNTDL